ncbi:MAG: bifunctional folylpolyglutamate synthase/dihydrofolate synthase [Phycisphaerae bacterium]|nr:MAG: bifunctional folylpolyglutamate synthase/dihydrofolate synthase [Phycisphaerae bacterium]
MAAKKTKLGPSGAGVRDPGKDRKLVPGRPFSNDAEAVAYLRERVNIEAMRPTSIDAGKAFRLDRMAALLERLGNPHGQFKCVHVAGSKGKGSVCEMIAAGLGGCGYAVGVYTSPHLVDVRERIRVGADQITVSEFTAHLGEAAAAAESLPKPLGEASYFEVLTAVAFLYFAAQAVDLAVIEVGLGGRFDATNVIRPEVCAITSIQSEHAQLLGPTIEHIAAHKAGIFKPGVPVVSVPQTPDVAAVLKAEAERVGCPLAYLSTEGLDFSYRFESSHEHGPHLRVGVSTPRLAFEHVRVPLRGEHQAFNCGLALAAIERLGGAWPAITSTRVLDGLAGTPTNGRLELVHTSPRVWVDGAHTPESIRALIAAISAQVRYDSMICVFGCAADKDVAGMLKALARGADKVIFTRAGDHARAADPRDLNRKFAEAAGKAAQVTATVREALQLAGRGVGKDDIIVVTGSFAVAGEAKRLLAERAANTTQAPTLREIKPSGIAPRRDLPR